jgi:CheY-like chemotaxis protein
MTAEDNADLAKAPRAGAGDTVLIVDDEPSVRMLVTEVLSELGYTAIEAADGSSALRVLQSDTRIDLLVTDVGLPGGMNGRQLADFGRIARPELKVLFITGYAEKTALARDQMEAGMGILTKPFAMEGLAGRIKELISANYCQPAIQCRFCKWPQSVGGTEACPLGT